MKLKYGYLSWLLICLPLLTVIGMWEVLPDRFPLHFTPEGQPDQYASRQVWMGKLLIKFFSLTVFRAMLLVVIARRQNLLPARLGILSLISAGTVAGVLTLLIVQGIWVAPVYREWLPLLFFLSGSCFCYFAVPVNLPMNLPAVALLDKRLAHRLANLQYLHTLSRLIVLRANLLVIVLMVFVPYKDRWTMGILANALAYACLVILSDAIRRNSHG